MRKLLELRWYVCNVANYSLFFSGYGVEVDRCRITFAVGVEPSEVEGYGCVRGRYRRGLRAMKDSRHFGNVDEQLAA